MRLILAIVLGLWLGDPAVAKPRSLLDTLVTPMPANVNFVAGLPPGADPASLAGTMQTVPETGTIYYQGKPDAFARAHEVGHLLDRQILTDGDRRFFQKLMHAPGGEWRSGTGAEGYSSASEWFADYYGASALGLNPAQHMESSYANIGPKRLRRFETAMDRLAQRRQLRPYQP